MGERYAIGLDLGGTDLKAGLVAADGTIHQFLRRPSRTQESAEAPFEVMLEAAGELKRRAGDGPVPVGLGCPGVIDPCTGALIGGTPHLPHWNAMPLRERLSGRLGAVV